MSKITKINFFFKKPFKSLSHIVKSLTFILILCSLANAGRVSLDTTFNGTGYRVQTITAGGSVGESLGIGSDGKIVLGGWTIGTALYDRFAAMRVNPTGTLDTGFDSDGFVITAVGNFDRGDTLLVQPDGKTLLSGDRYFGSSNDDFTILRYNTDGTLDNSFDGNGVAAPVVNGFSDEHCYDMALQPDGKIILVGTTAGDDNLPTDIAVMRLNTDGSLDTTFSGSGILVITFNNVSEAANAVVIQPDGKIVIGGFLNDTFKNEYLLMRLEANGMLDASFGSGGLVITSVSASNNSISTMALQSDGKILAGGTGFIARYDANGGLDNSFGTGGTAASPNSVNKLLFLNSGKILVGGTLNSNIAVSRFNQNGTIDTSFNATGTATATAPGNQCFGRSIATQTDNKIVVGGDCTNGGGNRFAVFRLQEATKSFCDFDGDGKTDISIFRPSIGEWWYSRSIDGGNYAAQFGNSADKLVPGDYTGDGRADIAVFRPVSGEWFILRSEDGSYYSYPFGTNGDIPAVGDFDGDGKADSAVFRPSDTNWYIRRSSDSGFTIQQFGANGDVPAVADYDGDGKSDIAIWRASVGEWWIKKSSNSSVVAFQFGNSADKPVQGDYTGDGKADVAIWRPSTGEWFILRSNDFSYYSFPFGTSGDVPAAGDFDGDGRFDATVFRPSQSTWYVQRSTAGTLIQNFGQSGDVPVPNAFVQQSGKSEIRNSKSRIRF
ncbi:MAG: FG-GAP-like repeat-containing protein [Pyrinomonadaceae bacterium]